jgi:AraC-like DNA-binding protein
MHVFSSAERPVGTRSVTTTDVDEARVTIGTYFYPTFLDVLGSAADLSARFDLVTSGPVTIGDMRFGVDVGLRFGELGAYHVDLPLTGELWWRQGRRPAVAGPATAAVFQPVGDTTLERWHADCRLLAVKIDQQVLQTHLASLLDAPVRTPVTLDTEFDVSSGPGRTWAGLVRVLATESRVSGGLLGHAGPAEHLQQSLVAGLLALASPQYREAAGQGIRGWAPRTVKRVVEAIHAHPANPFTMASLAEIAGVSARTLQDAFRRHVGTPPMTYLRDLRLANAHRELHRAGPEETTVAQVAYAAGFAHLGRFAAAYRARYGVAPSQTLRG